MATERNKLHIYTANKPSKVKIFRVGSGGKVQVEHLQSARNPTLPKSQQISTDVTSEPLEIVEDPFININTNTPHLNQKQTNVEAWTKLREPALKGIVKLWKCYTKMNKFAR